MNTWKNKQLAEDVKKIIDDNFNILGKYLAKNILSLSTIERESLTASYRSDGLLVYDTDEDKWFEYNDKSGSWEERKFGSIAYTKTFTINDWDDNVISLPHSIHGVDNPIVQMFYLNDDEYSPVVGGVNIDSQFNVTLSTDLPFDGKVVVK